ncbi:alpha-1,4-glucan--maltose-1-phosphate maltosyltransferase [Chitinispirillales bacterium ANBcel5]|uniref:alpha-1,4-glucan--maltose-1-phosphate maltosyltransferase n=1 Tax=Cellulosispirillum alkaliphilum TaxID=3039283 RepID=UPI002A58D0A8|nr:alpha-1,4-glucan--maltose-1-phosphate maltosyltransferase [Chitinispirillales bacterium ANBcel5]
MENEGRKRAIIENVRPRVDEGKFAIKRVEGEDVTVWADCFADGHEIVDARVLYKNVSETKWNKAPMRFIDNDRWMGHFRVERLGTYRYTVEAWVDHFLSWRDGLEKKFKAQTEKDVDYVVGLNFLRSTLQKIGNLEQKIELEELIEKISSQKDRQKRFEIVTGERLFQLMKANPDTELSVTYSPELEITVERQKALFSSWYEFFPRSCSTKDEVHGTLQDCRNLLPYISQMGFDVVYLPPIHPIGELNRKGKNNSTVATSQDPGSPWAIGSRFGGHKSIQPELGSIEDFTLFIKDAASFGLEVALDIAFQCAPDHPYVIDHPEWFSVRPDGSIQYAENPPKKYEDIVPFNFETPKWQSLWNELKGVVEFWVDKGVKIFRVDNPHTKPFPFWEWLIREIKEVYPETIFLSEAFTRPKIMYRLAKLGFSQSYTYFTWRNTKRELIDYMEELTKSNVSEFFRPNFWPNTPDILPEVLQFGGENAFALRLILAATLSSNYGIYGPAYEQCVSEAVAGKEEYLNSEKYQIYTWDLSRGDKMRSLIEKVNKIRNENNAFKQTSNTRFYRIDNEYLLFYGKFTADLSEAFLVVVNLDPFHEQGGKIYVPLLELGIESGQAYLLEDLLSGEKFVWHDMENYVSLSPHKTPAYIFKLKRKVRKESDFDYY